MSIKKVKILKVVTTIHLPNKKIVDSPMDLLKFSIKYLFFHLMIKKLLFKKINKNIFKTLEKIKNEK